MLENDWQIVCGQSLDYIVRNPSSACVFPENYQDYVDALTDKAWVVVTIQPFPGATGLAEVEAISDIIDLAGWRSSSGETRYLIYCTWPIVPVFIRDRLNILLTSPPSDLFARCLSYENSPIKSFRCRSRLPCDDPHGGGDAFF